MGLWPLSARTLFTRRWEGVNSVDSRITRVRVYFRVSGKSTKSHPTHFTCFQVFYVIITHIFAAYPSHSFKNESVNV